VSAPALVTGATGWLGARLVRCLCQGPPDVSLQGPHPPARRVRCLVQPGTAGRLEDLAPFVEVVEGDLRDPAIAARFSAGAEGATLFHCAGVVHPHSGTHEFYEVNVAGTVTLLRAAEAARVRRLVAVSSNSPFGFNRSSEGVFDEGSPYRPYRHYGRSKMQMELVVQEAEAQGNIETVIIRPPWFYGPGQPARQTRLFSLIKEGTVPLVGEGQNLRSMAYVDNVCQGLLLAENTDSARGQVYWIADALPYSMHEVIDTIERLLEAEFDTPVAHRRRRIPALACSVARGLDAVLQKTGFYRQELHVLGEYDRSIACSIEKAGRELGYQPAVDLEEGMRRSLVWCREQGIRF
jgi:nucleoside-diphosphate-sugar epimerase